MKTEIIFGQITFLDHGVPEYQHAHLYTIEDSIIVDCSIHDSDEIADKMMLENGLDYIIPSLYKGVIVYDDNFVDKRINN